jgi:hypothetical protein
MDTLLRILAIALLIAVGVTGLAVCADASCAGCDDVCCRGADRPRSLLRLARRLAAATGRARPVPSAHGLAASAQSIASSPSLPAPLGPEVSSLRI